MIDIPELVITHRIVSMCRAETNGSKSPMWRCQTSDGEKVNVFKHVDPVKDSFRLFALAGWGEDMTAMPLGQERTFKDHPIEIGMAKNGNWWEIHAVAQRPAGAKPDALLIPKPLHYRRAAARQAERLLSYDLPVIIWDSETTGLTASDEIISIAGMLPYGEVALQTLIKPRDMSAVYMSSHVHGLMPVDLVDAPTFPEVYESIKLALDGNLWVIYNAPFDTKMLDQMCLLYDVEPIRPAGVVDALTLFAEFNGDWSWEYSRFKSMKLTEAISTFGREATNAHNALGDCMTTLALLEVMAAWQPPAEREA